MPKIKTRSAKAKGRELQNHIRDRIRIVMGSVIRERDVDTAVMGERGRDIKLTEEAEKWLPLSIEAKNTTKHPSWKDFTQAINNVTPGTYPALAWKPRGERYMNTLITLRLEDLLQLLLEVPAVEEENKDD